MFGYAAGAIVRAALRSLAKKNDQKSESTSGIWRRLTSAYLGPEVIQLDQRAIDQVSLLERVKQSGIASSDGGDSEDLIKQQMAAVVVQFLSEGKAKLEAEWEEVYLMLEDYFADRSVPRDAAEERFALLSLGIALKFCVGLVASPYPYLNGVSYLCMFAAIAMILFWGFVKGAAAPYQITLSAKILREMKKGSKLDPQKTE